MGSIMDRFSKFVGVVCVCVMFALIGCQDKQEAKSQPKRDLFAYKLITSNPQDSHQATSPHITQSFIIEVLEQPSERLAFYPTQDQNTPTNDIGRSIFEQPKPKIVLFVQDDCKNCLAQAPYIVQLKEKYDQYLDLLILTAQPQTHSTSIDETLKAYYKSYPIYTPSDSQNLLEFLNKDISQGYLALFDQDGNKIIDYVGLVPPEMLERDILFLIHDAISDTANTLDSALDTTDTTQSLQDSTQDDLDPQKYTHTDSAPTMAQ